jgi:hypothetical protein
MVSKKRIPSFHRESNPDHPIVQPVAQSPYRLSYPALKNSSKGDVIDITAVGYFFTL